MMAEMMVETFEATEGTENLDEIQDLIDELGLEGQQKLVHPSGERNPFREMTLEENLVYKTLLPKEIALAAYDRGAIPRRVLEIARDNQRHFTELHVWCPLSLKDKDPLLLGVNVNPERTWERKYFMLARWGEALESYEVLKERAAKMSLTLYKQQLEGVRDQVEGALKQAKGLDAMSFLAMANGSQPGPQFYGALR
jgi:hypothetical protein